MNKLIYLDNAATTFPKSEKVYKKMDDYLRSSCVNAGRGGYTLARKATELIDTTREKLLQINKLPSSRQVILTPSATIALNQIIFGFKWDHLKNVYVTPFEHNSIMRPLQQVCFQNNIKIHEIPFDKISWELDSDKLQHQFAIAPPDYIFMSHVSNVTGFILPCEEIMKKAEIYRPIYILDSSQALGIIPMSSELKECDYIVFAGHKSLYGPMGIGGFISKEISELKPVILGGTGSESLNLQMPENGTSRYEAASYNIHAVAGLYSALEWIDEQNNKIYVHEKELTNYLVSELKKIPDVKLYLPSDLEKHCGIVSFNVEGWLAEEIGSVLDEDFNIAVRTGYHCAPLVHDFLETREQFGTVRISVGYFNSKQEIDILVNAINDLIEG